MPIGINGSGTITGISAGGLPDATITQAELASGVAGTGPAFSAENSANQSVAASTYTKLNADTERFDTNSNFASSRFTPTIAGYYQVNANAVMNDTITTGLFQIVIYKNGSLYAPGIAIPSSSTGVAANAGLSTIVYLNGSTDYVEIYAYQTSAAAKNVQLRDFSGCLVRAA